MNLTDEQIDSIEHAAYDAEVTLRSYSGRVMFGELCVGVSFDRIGDLTRFFVSLAAEDAPLAGKLCTLLRTDSLGLGQIAYWPGVSVPEAWAEQDDDEF